MQPSRLTLLFPAITFALLGAFLSGTLLVEHLAAERADCGPGCNELLSGRWATFPPRSTDTAQPGGIPVALMGVLYFLSLGLWLLAVGRLRWSHRLWHSLPMGVALLGSVVSLVLLAGMAYLETWCPLCVAVHAVNLVLAPYVVLLKPERTAEDRDDEPVSLQPVFVGLTLAACAGAAAWFGFESFQQRQRNRELATALEAAAARNSEPRDDLPGAEAVPATSARSAANAAANSDAASLWVVDSTVERPDTIVVFTDLLNPDCRTFEERLLAEIVPLFAGRVRVAVLHFPECAACNPDVAERSPWSCEAAYLAEAARQQAGARGFLRLVRALPTERTAAWTDEDAITLAIDTGLNPLRLLEDWQSTAVQQRVASDIAQARRAGVTSVPTVFVNGQAIDSQVRDRQDFWMRLASRHRPADAKATDSKSARPPAPQSPTLADKPAEAEPPRTPVAETATVDPEPTTKAAEAAPNRDPLPEPPAPRTSAPVVTESGPPAAIPDNAPKPEARALPPAPSFNASPLPPPAAVAKPAPPEGRSATTPNGAAVRISTSNSFESTPAPVLAQGLIKRYDSNGDGILQPAEYERIPGRFAKYDANGDGDVDADELEAAIGTVQRFKRLPPQLVPARTPTAAP